VTLVSDAARHMPRSTTPDCDVAPFGVAALSLIVRPVRGLEHGRSRLRRPRATACAALTGAASRSTVRVLLVDGRGSADIALQDWHCIVRSLLLSFELAEPAAGRTMHPGSLGAAEVRGVR
jgi:hypothetical protein